MTKKIKEIVEYAYNQAKKFNNIDMLLKCNVELKSGPLEDETKDDINSYFRIAIKNNLSYSTQILSRSVVVEDVADFKLLFDIVDGYDRFNLFKNFYKYAKLTDAERVKILTRAIHRNCINVVLLMFKHGIKLEYTNIPIYKPSRSDKMNAILNDQISIEKGVDIVSIKKEKPKSLYGELTLTKVLDKQIEAGRVNITLNDLDKERINYSKPDFLFKWAFKNDSVSFFKSIENDPKIEIDSRIKSLLKIAVNHSAKDIVKYIKRNYKDIIGFTERERKQHSDLYNKRRPVKKLTDKKRCIVCDGLFMGDNDNAFNTRCPSCEYLNYRPIKDKIVPNDLGPLITMPDSTRTKLDKLNDLIDAHELAVRVGNEFHYNSDMEIFLAKELNEPVPYIKHYLNLTNVISIDEVNKFYSVNGTFKVHNDFSHQDDSLHYMLKDELKEQIDLFLSELNDREKAVIKLRFGLTDEESDLTLEEVANILDVTRERVRMIESSAIKKLKYCRNRRRLEDYINMDNSAWL